ncbi:MAG: hypothetical protein K2M67_04670, partial [Muribaculaceae bacterium]|nr:hypothetical protein [Muribaculaceae bacterium]
IKRVPPAHLEAQKSVFNVNKTDVILDNIEVFKTVCDTCKRESIGFGRGNTISGKVRRYVDVTS